MSYMASLSSFSIKNIPYNSVPYLLVHDFKHVGIVLIAYHGENECIIGSAMFFLSFFLSFFIE